MIMLCLGVSIIITTHYIEEARQATCVGMMREGRLLEEDSPQSLMLASGLSTLEDVFLKLCVKDATVMGILLKYISKFCIFFVGEIAAC